MNKTLILFKKDFMVLRKIGTFSRQQSMFKIIFVSSFAFLLIAGLWMLFLEGFDFLDSLGGMGLIIIRHLFGLFFFGLGILLIISNIIISYAVLYRSQETPFLFLHPILHQDIILHKLFKITLFSSWSFFFIIIPFLGAYACYQNLSFPVIIWTLFFSIPFVVFCSSTGIIITLFAAKFLTVLKPATISIIILSIIGFVIYRNLASTNLPSEDITFMLSNLIPGIKITSYPLWPSWWIAEGIILSGKGDWSYSLLFFCLLLSYSLMGGLLVCTTGKKYFYSSWQKLQESNIKRKLKKHRYNLPKKVLCYLPFDTRAILVKDVKTLIRDPIQWTQGLLFFGLLGLYFFNLRLLQYHTLPIIWKNLIAFLNIFSLSAVMCSFCSRFIYPQLSLEGQAFWILGLAPTNISRILYIKFINSLLGMLILSVSLLSISMFMLKTNRLIYFSSLSIAISMSFGLCGLAIGLGAIFLDLRETNPAAIISGFGGTLNLVLSLIYMLIVIMPFAVLFHSYYSSKIEFSFLIKGIIISELWLIIISAVTVILPLKTGKRSLVSRDF
jgi:ABC-2 type transport system permease protein